MKVVNKIRDILSGISALWHGSRTLADGFPVREPGD